MKRTIAILLCCALSLGLFGCGSQKDAYTPTGDGLTWDEDYTGEATRPSVDGSSQEVSLIYYPNETMNPYNCTDFTNRALFSLLYQSLFVVDRAYNISPMLCKNYSYSEDMKTWSFTVENATFSDGSVLTAADVSASLNAAMESPYYAGRFTHIKSVTQEGDSVVITLDTPYENLPLLLDIPIVRHSDVANDRPLGTGPYVLEDSGSAGVLRRRADWWCKAEMTVTAASISLLRAEDNAQIRDSFEFEDLSLVCADPCSDKYADYRCDYELWDIENNIFLYLACNMNSSVFSNPEVRSALSKAVDRNTLTENFYRGFARSASLPASPLSPYYNDTLAGKYAYDGGEALKNAVIKIQLPENPLIFLVNSDDSLRLRVAKAVVEELEKSGLVIQLSALSTGDYNYALQTNNYDLYLGQTKLSNNMDLSPFFSSSGSLSYGNLEDVALYTMCNEALANHGNFYTLHQNVMNDGRLVPILVRSYAIYATRGLLTSLTPARDNIFYYTLGKTMEKALLSQ